MKIHLGVQNDNEISASKESLSKVVIPSLNLKKVKKDQDK
jgi:hypothetical protein